MRDYPGALLTGRPASGPALPCRPPHRRSAVLAAYVRYVASKGLTLDQVEQVRDFLPQLGPLQIDDTDTTISQMGRPALHTQVEVVGRTLDLVSRHLKSKLLTDRQLARGTVQGHWAGVMPWAAR
jgi:hypothetical protein